MMDCLEWKRSGFVRASLQHEQGARDEHPRAVSTATERMGAAISPPILVSFSELYIHRTFQQ